MQRPAFPLSYKLLIAMLLLLYATMAVFYLSYRYNKSYLDRLVTQNLEVIADTREVAMSLYLSNLRNRIQDFASDGMIREMAGQIARGDASKGGAIGVYLTRNKLPLLENFHRLSFLGTDGVVKASTNKAVIGRDSSKEAYFISGLNGVAVSERKKGGVGEPEIAVSAPVFDLKSNRPIGVLAGLIPLSTFNDLLSGMPTREHIMPTPGDGLDLKTLESYIVNRDKLMLSESKFIEGAIFNQVVDTEPVIACLERGWNLAGTYKDYRGVEVEGASVCLKDLGWTLLVEADRDEVLKPIGVALTYAAAGGAAMGLMIIVSGAYVMRAIVGQVRGLSVAADEVANGNYDVTIPVRSRDEIGMLTGSFNKMARDIKKRAAALEESEARLNAILENTINVVYMKDMEGRHVFVNRRFESIVDRKKEDIYGRTNYDLFPYDTANAFTNHDMLAMASSTPIECEETVNLPDGDRTYLSVKFVIRDASGRAYALCGISTDITERKRAVEEARRLNVELEQRVFDRTARLDAANRELEAFSYSVAHDLKTPLLLIDGFSRSLMKRYAKELGEQCQDHLGRIISASERMGKTIEALLRLSHAMRTEIRRERVDVSAVATEIADELKRTNPEREVRFVIEEGLWAECDPGLIRIVLHNLIGNAWKFTSRKEDAIIEFGATTKDDCLCYYVRDNGAGFDMESAEKIFGAFERLHPVDEYPGTGIGLATVRRIVERHGGKISAESKPGQGASFYFSI